MDTIKTYPFRIPSEMRTTHAGVLVDRNAVATNSIKPFIQQLRLAKWETYRNEYPNQAHSDLFKKEQRSYLITFSRLDNLHLIQSGGFVLPSNVDQPVTVKLTLRPRGR